MGTIRIVAEFLQQQTNNGSFGYEIYNNGVLVDKVDKTFKSEIIEIVGNIVSLDSTNNFNYVGDFTTGFNNEVYNISKQSTGKYIVSGRFTQYNGQPALGICRLNEDFSLDNTYDLLPLTTLPFSFRVQHKLLSDDSIIIYGIFQDDTNPFAPLRLAKLNEDGSIDTTFRAISFSDRVYDIAIDGSDNIYAVGAFTTYTYLVGVTPTTVSSPRIARLTSNGTYDSAFVVGAGCTSVQFIIGYNPVSDTVVIGGTGTYKGDPINGLLEINNVGTRTSKYYTLAGDGGGNIVTAMYFNAAGDITVSGWFSSYNGIPYTYLIRIKNDTGDIDNTLPPTAYLNVPAITITGDGTYTYLGGSFTVFGGISIDKFVKIDNAGDIPPYSQYDFVGARVQTIFLDSVDKVLVGGLFSTYANVFVPNNETIIPIGTDSEDTQAIVLQNLIDFNSGTGLSYSSVNNNILVEYTYDDGDIISIINAFDITNYLELSIDGESLIPTVTISNYPQILTPVYNPVTFKFDSPSVVKAGFRYLFNVYNTKDNSLIANFKLSPQIDGTGYIDISKILSNLVSVDLPVFINDFNIDTDLITYDANKSYVDYYTQIGVEFNQSWNFDNIYSYNGNVALSNSIFIGHSYIAGDQITVNSSLSGNAINGLHQVIEVIDSYNIVIDTPFVSGTSETTFGTTRFADNTKLSYPNIATITGVTAFNGARSWNDFVNWNNINYSMNSVEFPAKFLTDIPSTGFNITPTQDIYLNIHFDKTASIYPIIIAIETNNNITSFIDELSLSEISGSSIQQVAVGFNQISELFSDCYPLPPDCIEYYDLYLLIDGDPELRVSEKIRFNIDRRCKIEDYEILFMDRMGSLVSYAFQLRASEKGNIKRDMFKQQVDYDLTPTSYLNSYDITERGSTITNVNVTKTLELNTNWMTDEMSVYFEQLLSSPYTWIKIDGKYYACIVNDSDFEIVRQKNKNLIRKTVTITMANNNTINI